MALPREFWEQLPRKTDVELYNMLLQHGDYLPEALAAAEEELRKRNLTPEKVQEIAAAAAQSRILAAQSEAHESDKRRRGKIAAHVFLWVAAPLLLLLMKLISALFSP